MVPAGLDPLVAGGAAADLEALDEAELLELLEGAVDAGPARGGFFLRRSSSSSSSAVTAQSWRASASTTAVRAPPRRSPAVCSAASACSAQPVSGIEVGHQPIVAPARGRFASGPRRTASR